MWFAVVSLVGTLLFVRLAIHLPFPRSFAAAAAMTALSWSFVAAVPLPLLTYWYVNDFYMHRTDDKLWVLPLILVCSLTGAGLGAAVLATFKQKPTTTRFVSLVAVNLACVVVAAVRMWAYVDAHPPQA